MKKKKILYILIGIITTSLLVYGFVMFYNWGVQKREEAKLVAFETITVEAKDEYKDTIELTSESNKINVLDMIELKSSDKELDTTKYTLKPVDYETIDTSNSGNYGVKLIATTTDSYGEEATKEYTINFKVADTIKPEIKIKEETITLDFGATYDPLSNIETITDNIDGNLEKSENLSKGKSGYTLTTKLDTSTAGEYVVTINAKDSADNKEKATFTIVVKEKVVVQQRPTTTNKSNNTTISNNTNSSNSTSSSNNSTPVSNNTSSGSNENTSTNTPSETPSNNNTSDNTSANTSNNTSSGDSCVWNHDIGNSGFSGTYEEATAYAKQKGEELDEEGWNKYPGRRVQLYKICDGVEYWTVILQTYADFGIYN